MQLLEDVWMFIINFNDLHQKHVYKLHCNFYEHKKRNHSAIYKHASDADHEINYEHPKILASDNIKIRLQIKETLLIKDLAANKSLNVNINSFQCKLW